MLDFFKQVAKAYDPANQTLDDLFVAVGRDPDEYCEVGHTFTLTLDGESLEAHYMCEETDGGAVIWSIPKLGRAYARPCFWASLTELMALGFEINGEYTDEWMEDHRPNPEMDEMQSLYWKEAA